jgi:hypothetical protein
LLKYFVFLLISIISNYCVVLSWPESFMNRMFNMK